MSFDTNKPADNSPLDAAEMRAQMNALKAQIDAAIPVGFIGASTNHLANTPALPGTWARCDGQTLSLAGSPFDGLGLPDLNGASGPQCFLRGAANSGGNGG